MIKLASLKIINNLFANNLFIRELIISLRRVLFDIKNHHHHHLY